MATKGNYNRILVTTEYDQPYIYFLWYGHYDPQAWVNDGEFAKRFDTFEFRSVSAGDLNLHNALLVGSPKEITTPNPTWIINLLDGTPAFVATET